MSGQDSRDSARNDHASAHRELAQTLYLTFVALTDAGFTETQAMRIVVGIASGTVPDREVGVG